MIDWTKPVWQKGSKKIWTVLTSKRNNEGFPVVAMDENGMVEMFSIDGQYLTIGPSSMDLENIPEEKPLMEVWIPQSGNGMYYAGQARFKKPEEIEITQPIIWTKFQEVRE